MNHFNLSIDYSSDERSPREDVESLHHSVQLMCQMWNDIAQEFDAQQEQITKPVALQRRNVLTESITSTKQQDKLSVHDIKGILDENMDCDLDNLDNESDGTESEEQHSDEESHPSAYDKMFAGR
jgi:hypothetical protein